MKTVITIFLSIFLINPLQAEIRVNGIPQENLVKALQQIQFSGGHLELTNEIIEVAYSLSFIGTNSRLTATNTIIRAKPTMANNLLVVDSRCKNCTISGLILEGSPGQIAGSGLWGVDAADLTVENITVRNFPGAGILLRNFTNTTIQNNIVEGNAHGIVVSESNRTIVSNNRVLGSSLAGILLYTADLYNISNNIVDGSGQNYAGIRCAVNCGNGIIANNQVKNTDRGIHLVSGSRHTVISGNIFEDIRLLGLFIQDAYHVNINNNIFQNTGFGTNGVEANTALLERVQSYKIDMEHGVVYNHTTPPIVAEAVTPIYITPESPKQCSVKCKKMTLKCIKRIIKQCVL